MFQNCPRTEPGYIPQPYHLPGYGGHVPSLRYRIGKTFGHASRDVLEDPCVAQAPIPILQKPFDRKTCFNPKEICHPINPCPQQQRPQTSRGFEEPKSPLLPSCPPIERPKTSCGIPTQPPLNPSIEQEEPPFQFHFPPSWNQGTTTAKSSTSLARLDKPQPQQSEPQSNWTNWTFDSNYGLIPATPSALDILKENSSQKCTTVPLNPGLKRSSSCLPIKRNPSNSNVNLDKEKCLTAAKKMSTTKIGQISESGVQQIRGCASKEGNNAVFLEDKVKCGEKVEKKEDRENDVQIPVGCADLLCSYPSPSCCAKEKVVKTVLAPPSQRSASQSRVVEQKSRNRSPYVCPSPEDGRKLDNCQIYRSGEPITSDYAGHVPGLKFLNGGRSYGKATWETKEYMEKYCMQNMKSAK